MAIYTVGVRTPAAAAGAAYADLRTAASDRVNVREIGIFTSAATASGVGLVRSTNAGVASTTAAPQPSEPANPGGTSLVGTAWTTAPTAGAVFLRRAALPAAVGAGFLWVFAPGELWVPVSSSLLLWNFGAAVGAALDVYFTIDE